MTKDNVVDFLTLGQSFRNKTLLEAAVLKCSQEIWFVDAEVAALMWKLVEETGRAHDVRKTIRDATRIRR